MLNNPGQTYFDNARDDILPLLKAHSRRILDVGCGQGATGRLLKEKKIADEVYGIEINSEAAKFAESYLDQVIVQDLNVNLELPFESDFFDTILCLDVLEHLIDPWSALRQMRRLLRDEGRILVSVPNVQHFRTSLPLVFGGKWDYQDAGTLDITHLRFFTKSTARGLATKSGYKITNFQASNKMEGPKARLLKAISFGVLSPLLDYQYLIELRK